MFLNEKNFVLRLLFLYGCKNYISVLKFFHFVCCSWSNKILAWQI